PVVPQPPEPGVRPAAPERPVLPTLFGEGYGLYRSHRSTIVLSYLAHLAAVGLLFLTGRFVATHRQEIRQPVISMATDIRRPYVLLASPKETGGGGGGGDHDKLAASKGARPNSHGDRSRHPLQ